MRKIVLIMAALFLGRQGSQLFAQTPGLPLKGTLSQTLISNRVFTNSSQMDTVMRPLTSAGSYTLEVKARVNNATGRGLDLEGRNQLFKGFRLSLDTAYLKNTASLTSSQTISAARAGTEYVVRVAVKNDTAHFFQNGAFLLSQPLSTIKDIINGVETAINNGILTGPNVMVNWKGTGTDTLGKPIKYGWARVDGDTTIFNVANGGSGVRYMDINASSGSNAHTYNGSPYVGRVMYIRWDGSTTQNAVYTYPVTLEANTTYAFSWLVAYINNAGSGPQDMTVGIGATTSVANRIAFKTFTTTGTRVLKKDDFTFTSQSAGQYYITITGSWGLYACAELEVRKAAQALPRFVFGKNYPTGAVDLQIIAATYEEGAYAPDAISGGTRQTVVLTGSRREVPTSFNTDFVVPGSTEVHLSGENTPYVNSSVALNGSDAWLIFDNVKPSTVISNWLGTLTLNGQPAVNGSNVRVAIYRNGAVVIPNGVASQQKAITLYTGENFTGDSATYEIFTIHDSLGVFDNRFRSFKLKRGYSATIGSNAQGLGFSKVYTADMHDIAVTVMPKGLYGKVSFVRAFKWDYVSKKGWAGGGAPLEMVNATWNYDWSASGNTTANTQFVPIRQNGGWPDFNSIYTKQNSNHLLGFNEPDRPDQANMTVEQAIEQWPLLLKSGFRLGSPAPSTPNSWLKRFMDKADSLNYRVDFTAVHCYWNSRVSGGRADSWYSGLLNTYNTWGNKRPIWITEWNNGANWTGESWPVDTAAAFQKQLSDLRLILQVFDTTSFIERYSIYNWVENKRAMVLADTLTPAGKYYAANKSALAYTSDSTLYKPADSYDHTWRIAAPVLTGKLSADYKKVTLSWLDINGDLGASYALERKRRTDTGYIKIAELFLDSNYAEAGTVNYMDSITYDTAYYRLYAISYEGGKSWYSANLMWTRDALAVPPLLSGKALAATWIDLSWTTGSNARAYRLKRSGSRNGEYAVLTDLLADTTYHDKGLVPDTSYYYTISALNSGGESVNGDTILVRTPVLVAPDSIKRPRLAAGDTRITLSWDFQYDVKYKVLRATADAGPYDTIAFNMDSLRFVDRNKTNNQQYHYRVIAYNDAGQSAAARLTGQPVAGQHLHINFDGMDSAFAEDSWGGYHALFASAAVRGTGKSGQALQLNGTANSYAYLKDKGPVSDLTNFTVSTWVNINSLSNWMRVFDFGSGTDVNMFLTPQAGTSGGLPILRYGIKKGGAEQVVSYPFAFPLNSWTHLAVSQAGSTVKLYVNGVLVATNDMFTIHPADLGNTNQNYFGKSQYNDPLLNGFVDDFRIYNEALSDTDISRLAGGLEPQKWQVIHFAALSDKRIGDPDFAVSASTSSGLPLSYISSDTTIASINNRGVVELKAAGLVTITAVQGGNDEFKPTHTSQAFAVLPYKVHVEYVNGNGTNATSNTIRPNLRIVNEDSVTLNYKELSIRYWITAENYSGINTWIDYATLGNKITSKYVWLPAPRNGALGYVEYTIDSAAGFLAGGLNTGVIQSRVANTKWGVFNEQDDYSYSPNSTYATNNRITLYRNGKLIGGSEPVAAAPNLQVSVVSQNVSSGQNTIKANIQIKNTGNVPVNFEDLKVRYWFTAEGNATLNYWIDYAELGAAAVNGNFNRLAGPLNGADAYLEFGFSPSLGTLYPLCNTGAIQYRITKADWSAFDQQNDYSYSLSGLPVDNNKMTVYYKGTRIAGVEPLPVNLPFARSGTTGSEQEQKGKQGEIDRMVQLYPNPVNDKLIIQLQSVGKGAWCRVFDAKGGVVASVALNSLTQQLFLSHVAAGIYQVMIYTGEQIITEKIVKQ